ncbi:hypothetical protein COO60DRAFT_763757 [Scenedesmus sp. NREL 46B-D3]|nr:hypothetical protein COO60DRAFT_763757 [Scenedesmus sp. NREL 46B-D3]
MSFLGYFVSFHLLSYCRAHLSSFAAYAELGPSIMTTLAALSRSASPAHCHGLRQQARPQPRPFTAAVRSSSSYSSALHARSNKQQHAGTSWQTAGKDMLLKPLQATENEGSTFDFEEPETAREAIDLGLVLCKQQKWDKALTIFEKGLTLPGTGIKRFRDKPRLISDGEKMACLYNVACCHAQLQDARSGLVALSGCMEVGYTDFARSAPTPTWSSCARTHALRACWIDFRRRVGDFWGWTFQASSGTSRRVWSDVTGTGAVVPHGMVRGNFQRCLIAVSNCDCVGGWSSAVGAAGLR